HENYFGPAGPRAAIWGRRRGMDPQAPPTRGGRAGELREPAPPRIPPSTGKPILGGAPLVTSLRSAAACGRAHTLCPVSARRRSVSVQRSCCGHYLYPPRLCPRSSFLAPHHLARTIDVRRSLPVLPVRRIKSNERETATKSLRFHALVDRPNRLVAGFVN